MNPLDLGCLSFHEVPSSLPHLTPTLICEIKRSQPLLNANTTLFLLPFIFVDACDNLVMADDVATPSNPPVAPVDKEELEEAPLDKVALEVNVSQWLREEEPSKRVVRIRVNSSAWDRRLSPNPHALAIYLKFVPA